MKLKDNQVKSRKRPYCPICNSNPENTTLEFLYSKNSFTIKFYCNSCELSYSSIISKEVLKSYQLNQQLKKEKQPIKKRVKRKKVKLILVEPETEEDFYKEETLDSYVDDDMISSEEEAFMLGYLAS